MLTLYLNASLKHAEKITNCRLYDNAVPDDDPDGLVIEADIKLAMMLLVSHWYENREPVSSDSVNSIPFGVDAILKQHRKIPRDLRLQMACEGCRRRREWLKKWSKIAYERATGKRADSSAERTNSSTARADGSDKPPG